VSADGGEALATAPVTVQDGGLTPVAPVVPTSATATVTGPDEVTVTWTPAADDNADGYVVRLDDSYAFRYAAIGSGNSTTITGIDLVQPQTFSVRAANAYGQSPATVTGPVGGTSPWSTSTRVNDDSTATSQVSPEIALGPDGAAIAVWQDYRASPPSNLFGQIDIYASRRDPATGAWAANARVNDVTTGEQYKPSIAVDANNNAYAVWVDGRNGRSDIYFAKRSAATGLWGANVRVNTATSFNTQDAPAIAVSPSGDAIALWYRVANNKLNIWSARLPAGGTTWGPEIRVTSNQSAQKQAPSVTFGPNGTAYVVWMQPATGDADIWFASLASGSSTWSTNTKASDDPGTAFQSSPDIAVDGAGNVFVAWTDRRVSPYQLRVRKRTSAGVWGTSALVAADGGNAPSIAVRADGWAYLVWHDGDQLTEYPRLWGAGYDPAAGTWTTPDRIDANGPDHGAKNGGVALDAASVVVVWSNGLGVPSGENNDDILARVRAP
jgi:hypothetical protein